MVVLLFLTGVLAVVIGVSMVLLSIVFVARKRYAIASSGMLC
jgi:hypothetical protein